MKYLKYTYNKYGDQGYLLFVLRNNVLKWFLGLDTDEEYKNTRGPVDIVDIEDLKFHLEDGLADTISILHEYVDKYRNIDKYNENVNIITELIEWLENKEETEEENE